MAAQPTVFQRRIHVGAAISLFAFLVVGGQLIHVTAFHAAQVAVRKAPQVALTRSDLVDRNGELIARALPADDLYARPQLIKDKHAAALALAAATGADPDRVAAVLKDKYTSALIARQVSQAARAKVTALKLPGLEYLPNSKRDYPFGRTTAQVVGVTDSEGKGVSGDAKKPTSGYAQEISPHTATGSHKCFFKLAALA